VQSVGVRAGDIPASSHGADNVNYKVWQARANEQLHKTGMLPWAGSGPRTGDGSSLAPLCRAPVSTHVRTAPRPQTVPAELRSAAPRLCVRHAGGSPWTPHAGGLGCMGFQDPFPPKPFGDSVILKDLCWCWWHSASYSVGLKASRRTRVLKTYG